MYEFVYWKVKGCFGYVSDWGVFIICDMYMYISSSNGINILLYAYYRANTALMPIELIYYQY